MAAKETYLKGQLLLDSGQLSGSFFQHTVVLICQHDAEGAFGLVLNRTTGNKVGEMIVADLPEALQNSVEIAKRCNLTLKLGKPHLPDLLDRLERPGIHQAAFRVEE